MNHRLWQPTVTPSSDRHRPGVVLLLTLVVIAMAGLVLAGLARYRLELAMKTADLNADCQLRWGSLSLRRSLAYQAQQIVDRSAESAFYISTTPTTKATVTLGSIPFDVTVQDESAKLNLNRVTRFGGRAQLLEKLLLLSNAGRFVELRTGGILEPARPFSSWGEVFDLAALPMETSAAKWVQRETDFVTCWGSGRLHFQRTPENVLASLSPFVSTDAIRKLIDTRRLKPALTLPQLLDEAELGADDRLQLEFWLTDKSDCASIWICANAAEHHHCELVIVEQRTLGNANITRFVW